MICAQLLVLLAGSELIVRWQQSRIRKSDRLEPELVRHDPELGWKLTPNWTGLHRTFDFEVRYTVNEAGWRADSPLPSQRDDKLIAVVGDSFTFGLGVNDDDTFVHLLNRRLKRAITFVNFSVPGYSTDQEALLIEREVLKSKPDIILLSVYVANDLFDNLLPYPLQVNHAKPRFALVAQNLVLTNVPVPTLPKPPDMRRLDLTTMALGPEASETWRARIERRSALFALLAGRLSPSTDRTREFEHRFAPVVELFGAIVGRIKRACDRHGVELRLLVLAGRSFHVEPASDSAQYQRVLMREVDQVATRLGIQTIRGIDPTHTKTRAKTLFYPHDGHLTPAGHEVLADNVVRAIR